MGFLFSKEKPAPAQMVQVAAAPAAVEKPQNRVLVIGGAYAGLNSVVNLLNLASGADHRPSFVPLPPLTGDALRTPLEITLVDEKDGFYHTIGSPLALASDTYSAKAWTKYADIPAVQHAAVRTVQGSVTHLDCATKTATIVDARGHSSTVRYDYAICCSGLRREHPTVPQSLFRDKYLAECKEHIDSVRDATESIVIIGGGAVGVEMAGELKLCFPDKSIKLIHSHTHVLNGEPLPDAFKDTALRLLREQGVEPLLSERVVSATPDSPEDSGFTVRLLSGKTLRAGKVVWAISRPVSTATYLPRAALNEEGLVAPTPELNLPPAVPNSADHFVAGDVVEWSGIKRCGAAMAMGQFAAINVHQRMVAAETGAAPAPMQMPAVQPMIALAVGAQAATYYAGNVQAGKEQLKSGFGDDLGLTICWNHMQLKNLEYGKKEVVEVEEEVVIEKVVVEKVVVQQPVSIEAK